jgi:uncharacterized protein involved in outer membrane biogenesis
MGKAVRYLAYAVAVALLVVAAVVAAVALLVEPDDYRDEIAAAVRRATGRELALGGPLGLTLWPCCSLSVADASLGNPPGFAAGPFVAVRSAALGFRIWPLLTAQRLSVDRIAVTGLQANLQTDAAGRSNWTFTGADDDATPAAGDTARPLQLDLAGLTVREGALTWQDARDGTDYAVTGLQLETGPIRAGDPVPVTASLSFTDRRDQTTGTLDLTGTATLADGGTQASFATPVIEATLRGPALPVAEASIRLTGSGLQLDYGDAGLAILTQPVAEAALRGPDLPGGEAVLKLAGDELRVAYGDASRVTMAKPAGEILLPGRDGPVGEAAVRFAATLLQLDYAADPELGVVELAGDVTAAGSKDWPAIKGQFGTFNMVVSVGQQTRLQLPAFRTLLTLTGAPVPGGQADVEATFQGLELILDPMAGRFDQFSGKVTGPAVTAEVTAAGRFGTGDLRPGAFAFDRFSGNAPASAGTPGGTGTGRAGTRDEVAGTFAVGRMSLREVLAALDPEPLVTADPKALTALAGTGRFVYGDGRVSADDLQLTLDDTRVTGSVARTLEDRPRTRFDLKLDQLDADRYLEPDAPAGSGAAAGAEQPTDLPVATLRDLRLDGRARIGRLAWAGLKLADVDVTVAADGGRLRLDPLRAQLYGGSLAGSLGIDASGERARVTVQQQLRDVQLGPVLSDFADIRNITGRVVADLDLAGSGNTDVDLKRTLGGRLSLSLADGVYQGVDLWYEIRRARSLLRQEAAPARTGEPATPLKAVELAGPVADGVLTSEKFLAEIPFLRLSGTLSLDVPREQVQGDLQAKIFETPTFEDGTTLPDLVGARLPLTLKGPLAGPKVSVDFSRMVKEALKDTAREQLKGLQEKLLDRLGVTPPAGEQPAPGAEPAPGQDGEPPPADAAPKKKESSGDRLRKGLEKLLKPTE